jgi:hypothetical protein
MKVIIIILLAGAAMAESPKPKQIGEVDALKLEVASLKLDLMTKEIEAIHRERNEVIKGICAAADIPLDQCLIDPAKRTVTAKEKDAK